ncbi:MAG TPA: chloride channel protein, partial [Candidatus Krumholzibacterium sp.]|nr:chloride channel protein [Candidatus Krumholzibacterium sp.]
MDVHDYRQFGRLWKWILVSLVIGPATALTVAGFDRALDALAGITPGIFASAPYLLPIAGAVATGLLILRFAPGAGGEGIPRYLIAVNRDHGRISARDTFLKIPATLVTLGTYGCGGIVGPLSRIGAGIGSHVTGLVFRIFHISDEGIPRIAAICGVSGIISSIFHAPVAGGIFAVEILCSDAMRYSDIFPSIMTGCTAYITSAMIIGDAPVFSIAAPAAPAEASAYLWLPLVAVAAGAAGLVFIVTFERISRFMKRIPLGQPGPALVSGLALGILWLAGFRWVLGTSPHLFDALATGDLAVMAEEVPHAGGAALLILIVMIVKIVGTSITIGGGLSAGFTGPMLLTGLSSGALIAALAGADMGGPTYYMLMACSTAAVLGAALNVPVAAILLVTGIFGRDYFLAAAIGATLAFVIYKDRTIYEYSISRWPAVIDKRHREL